MNFGGGFEIATATFCGLAMTIFEQIPRPLGCAQGRLLPLGMTEESGLCLG